MSFGSQSCDSCMQANCCNTLDACFGDIACNGLLGCYGNHCANTPDPNTCVNQMCSACLGGATLLNAIGTCQQDHCLNACQ